MKDEHQMPDIPCSAVDVFSAWTVGAAVVFALLGISLLQERHNANDWIGEGNPIQAIDGFANEPEVEGLEFGRVAPQEAVSPGDHPYAAATNWSADMESK